MKLSALISYHYLVYVALALLVSTSKLSQPYLSPKVCTVEEVKHEGIEAADNGKVLHSELLFRY